MAEYDKVIPPGQEGSVTLEVQGDKVSGVWSKSAVIHTSDLKHPRLTVTVAGTVIKHVDVEPERVYLRGMYGEQAEADVTVSSNERKKDLKILEVSSNIDDKMTYKVVPDAEPGHYTIKIYKNPKLPTLNTWGSLYVKTNSENTPEKVVQVNVVTRGAIIVQPATLNFGSIGAAAPKSVEKTITVTKVKGDFHIRDVAFSSDFYKASVEPVEEGKQYNITVSFTPAGDQKSYVDEMIINTDDPNEPSIRIRLMARAL